MTTTPSPAQQLKAMQADLNAEATSYLSDFADKVHALCFEAQDLATIDLYDQPTREALNRVVQALSSNVGRFRTAPTVVSLGEIAA